MLDFFFFSYFFAIGKRQFRQLTNVEALQDSGK